MTIEVIVDLQKDYNGRVPTRTYECSEWPEILATGGLSLLTEKQEIIYFAPDTFRGYKARGI